MNTFRILLLALLAGTASAGCVWYLWGMAENFGTLRSAHATDDAEETEDETTEDTPNDANADDAAEVTQQD